MNTHLPPDYDDGSNNPLARFTHNLTEEAKSGKLDPVIGRNDEIRRVMQVLSRRTKNNPVLIGDPGVGKTAIVEGLAQRIVAKDVPETLQNKEVLVLDLTRVLGGAKYRGEFEERLKNIIKEIEKEPDKYILFIDELHTLVGAGGEGAMDAANILKPALARGKLRAIGATTIKEYRKYIEKDQALERRFQPVLVGEPSTEDTIAILRGIKEKYELHHGIRIQDDAIIAAVELSKRYITDRFLPDKAIDLIDEATSALKIETQSLPIELDTIKRKIMQLEIEQAALKKEKTQSESQNATRERLTKIASELINLQNELTSKEKLWREQRAIVAEIQQTKTDLDIARTQLEKAQREVDLTKAAELQYGTIPELEKKLKETEKKWTTIPEDQKILREEVTTEDIAKVVARWTGIPVTRLLITESQRLEHLEQELEKRIVGQNTALQKIANAIRRNRAGLSQPGRPIGSFLFLGPTGVGKTETAKALAEFLFNDENALIRIDMSEYQEAHNVSRLIGAPPGYIGYEEGGQLTEAVRRRPYSVILFDEVEKAHRQVFNVFLQILDDGRLTDGNGRVVDFKNTIIIMTSNLKEEQLQEFFRSEFLNRLDNIIEFNKLSQENLQKIVEIQLKEVTKRLEKQGIKLEISDKAKQLLAQTGFDPIYGARPLKRLIETQILDEIAFQIIEGKKKQGDTVHVDIQNNQIKIN